MRLRGHVLDVICNTAAITFMQSAFGKSAKKRKNFVMKRAKL